MFDMFVTFIILMLFVSFSIDVICKLIDVAKFNFRPRKGRK